MAYCNHYFSHDVGTIRLARLYKSSNTAAMTKDEAIAFFGSQSKVARILGLTQPTISVWQRIPPLCQLKLEEASQGKLVADDDVPRGYVSPPAE